MMEEDHAIAAAVYHCLFKDRVQQKQDREGRIREHTQVLGEYQTLLKAVLADGFVHPQERKVARIGSHPGLSMLTGVH